MHEENGVKKTRLVGKRKKKLIYECFDGALRNCVTSIETVALSHVFKRILDKFKR